MPSRTERLALTALVGCLLVPGPAFAGSPTATDRRADLLDEVGYAGVDAALDGVSASYGAATPPGHVEVTALSSGRTILVRVVSRAPGGTDRLVDLSCGAVRQLGISSREPVAVRVRRYSPSAEDMGALKAGREAGARLPTPESLLAVLRRKLPPVPKSQAALDVDACGGQPKPATAPMSSSPKQDSAPIRPTSSSPPTPVAAQSAPPSPGDHFIVEEPSERRSRQATPPPTGRFAVQAVAVSSRARADRLARGIGGFVEPAGKLFRVRKGPYADEASARSALKAVRAKGFAEACVVTIGGR